MDTQTIVILAVAINLVVAAAAIVLPRISQRRARRASRAFAASLPPITTDPVTAARPATEAASPWFPDRGGRSGSNGNGWSDGSTAEAWSPAHSAEPPLDPDTGLDVEVSWSRWLAEEEARIRRFHHPATVVLFDVAGYDRLAGRLGHETAERLIPPIASTMRRSSRASDHLARLGPTRFGALLPETDEVQAINFVERIRAACDLWLAAGAVAVRLAIGWSEVGTNRSVAVALPEAEQRLFADRLRPPIDDADPPEHPEPSDPSGELVAAASG